MICDYTDSGLGFEETIRLFEDRVAIAGWRRFGLRWERTVALAGLDPTPSRIWARHRPYSWIGVVVFFGMLILTVLVSFAVQAIGAKPHVSSLVTLATVAAWIGCVLVFLLLTRPIEFAMYRTKGHVQVFTVTCRRPAAREAFEKFIAAVSNQILQVAAA